MTRGRRWSHEEESRLREMVGKGMDLESLAHSFGRDRDAVRMKLSRMSLKVVLPLPENSRTTTTSLQVLPKEIVSHEQALSLLTAVLEALKQPGLDKVELQRFRILVDTVQAYDSVLDKFEKWDNIEKRFASMQKNIQELQKAQKVHA